MANYTFKTGDVVVFKDWDEMEKEYGTRYSGSIDCYKCFTLSMKPLCGTRATIQKVAADGQVYFTDVSNSYKYSTDMIKPINDDPFLEIHEALAKNQETPPPASLIISW